MGFTQRAAVKRDSSLRKAWPFVFARGELGKNAAKSDCEDPERVAVQEKNQLCRPRLHLGWTRINPLKILRPRQRGHGPL